PAFLMLLVGNVDPATERRLEGGPPPALQTLLRIAALFAAVLFAFTAQAGGRDLAYFRALLRWNAPTLLWKVAGWALTAAGLALGFFASTALFPACSSPERGAGFLRTTRRWWKRDGLFLLGAPLAVTLAVWAVDLPIQIPLVGWRSPGPPA